MLHSRVLFAVTLISLLWFEGSATTATQDNGKRSANPNASAPQISSISRRAGQVDPEAEYQLGALYMTGTNVPLDYRQALTWYRRAAEQNYPDAEFSLGYMYEQGEGVNRDYREAKRYYTAAAQQGHATAENNLGSLYEHGK